MMLWGNNSLTLPIDLPISMTWYDWDNERGRAAFELLRLSSTLGDKRHKTIPTAT